jgi:hypothetical protein
MARAAQHFRRCHSKMRPSTARQLPQSAHFDSLRFLAFGSPRTDSRSQLTPRRQPKEGLRILAELPYSRNRVTNGCADNVSGTSEVPSQPNRSTQRASRQRWANSGRTVRYSNSPASTLTLTSRSVPSRWPAARGGPRVPESG